MGTEYPQDLRSVILPSILAERAGFEPAVEVYSPYNRLAGGPIRPLWHLSGKAGKAGGLNSTIIHIVGDASQAEGEGFEPPVGETHSCFQDSRLRPLGHPSGAVRFYHENPPPRPRPLGGGEKRANWMVCVSEAHANHPIRHNII